MRAWVSLFERRDIYIYVFKTKKFRKCANRCGLKAVNVFCFNSRIKQEFGKCFLS